jgi:hypothetical protein
MVAGDTICDCNEFRTFTIALMEVDALLDGGSETRRDGVWGGEK